MLRSTIGEIITRQTVSIRRRDSKPWSC